MGSCGTQKKLKQKSELKKKQDARRKKTQQELWAKGICQTYKMSVAFCL